MSYRLLAVAAAVVTFPTFAASQDANTLHTYALIAKLEANVAEASGAIPLAVALAEDPEAVASATENFANDKAQLEGHLATLGTMSLTEEQVAELATFEATWSELAAQGESVLASPAGMESEILAWWDAMHELEERADVMLEAMLEAEGVDFDG